MIKRWWKWHSPGCGVEARGCVGDCPKRYIEDLRGEIEGLKESYSAADQLQRDFQAEADLWRQQLETAQDEIERLRDAVHRGKEASQLRQRLVQEQRQEIDRLHLHLAANQLECEDCLNSGDTVAICCPRCHRPTNQAAIDARAELSRRCMEDLAEHDPFEGWL